MRSKELSIFTLSTFFLISQFAYSAPFDRFRYLIRRSFSTAPRLTRLEITKKMAAIIEELPETNIDKFTESLQTLNTLKRQDSMPLPKRYSDTILSQAQKLIQDCSLQKLSVVLHGLGVLGAFPTPALFTQWQDRWKTLSYKGQHTSASTLARSFYGYALLENPPDHAFLLKLEQSLRDNSRLFNAQEITNTIYAYALLEMNPTRIWDVLDQRLMELRDDFTPIGLRQLYTAGRILNHRFGVTLPQAVQERIPSAIADAKERKATISRGETLVFNELKNIYGTAAKQDVWCPTTATYIDMSVELPPLRPGDSSRTIYIQFNGPLHYNILSDGRRILRASDRLLNSILALDQLELRIIDFEEWIRVSKKTQNIREYLIRLVDGAV